jgi:ribosomal protein S18 acetylase RimI-like enzyme
MDAATVRSFEPRDRSALIALWAEVFPNDPPRNAPASTIDNKLRVQPELLLVSVVNETLVGAVMAGFDGTRGWIHHLAVAPTHRRRGIATSLVAAAEHGLRRLGCPKVNLQVRAENAGVVAFYERHGYEAEPRVSMGKVLLQDSDSPDGPVDNPLDLGSRVAETPSEVSAPKDV